MNSVPILEMRGIGGAAVDLKKSRRAKPVLADPARVDRLPPHSLEAEQGVLGCALLSPSECLGHCVEQLARREEAFYDLRHQAIFDLLVAMWDRKEAIDLITVHQRLKDANQLEAVGGFAYLASLPDAVPSAANLAYYLDIVREKHLLRRMIQVCTGAVARVYEHEGEVDALLDEVERDVLRIAEDRVEAGAPDIQTLVNRAVDVIEMMHRNQGQLTGLASGFADLDKMTNGFQGGDMVVIAARPSVGKTSLALNIADHVAVREKLPVGVFSLEMTAEQLVLRMICARARVNLRSIREGFLAERDFPKLTAAAMALSNAPLHIDDTPAPSILQLRAKARRLWQQFGVKLFVVDYLQLAHSTNRRADQNRQQEISDISSGLKALAKELNVPVIVLSQLNRELEKDKSRKPRLADLRESGAIEQDADMVGLLYRVNPDPEAAFNEEGEAVNLLIAKQRNGPTGDVPLTFLKGFTRFESAAKVADEDVPEDR